MNTGKPILSLFAIATFQLAIQSAYAGSEKIMLDSTKLAANSRCLIKINGVQKFYGACNYDGLVLNDRRLIIACPKSNCYGATSYIKRNGIFLYAQSPRSAQVGGETKIAWNGGDTPKAHDTLDGFTPEGDCWVNARTDSKVCIYPL